MTVQHREPASPATRNTIGVAFFYLLAPSCPHTNKPRLLVWGLDKTPKMCYYILFYPVKWVKIEI